MALTLMQIFKTVAKVGGERPYLATLVRVRGFKQGKVKSDPKVLRRLLGKTWSIERKGNRTVVGTYATSIDFLNDRHVRVSCSCGDFWARWEYALWRKGAAIIQHSNGEPPDATNPGYKAGCCIAKGSYVLTPGGSKLIEDVRAGDSVLTLNGPQQVSDAGLTRRQTETVTLTFNDRELTATPDHKVLCVRADGFAPEWARADSVSPGDYLCEIVPTAPTAPWCEYHEAAGLFMAEHDELTGEPIDAYEAPYVTSLFNKAVNEAGVKGIRLSLSRTAVRRLSRIVGFDICEKRVPPKLFDDQTKLAAFMRGVWLADGWVSDDGILATVATVDPGLAKQYERAMRTLGIRVNTTVNHRPTDPNYVQHLVRVSDQQSWNRLCALLAGSPKQPTGWRVCTSELPSNRMSPFSLDAVRNNIHTRLLRDAARAITVPGDPVKITDVTSLGLVRGTLAKVLTRTKFPHACKPCYTAPKHAIHAALTINAVKQGRVLAASGHTRKRYQQFNTWLSASGHVPDAALSFYAKWTAEHLNYVQVQSSGKSIADVYDLSVPEGEHFTANGLVVHNCKHIIKLTDHAVREGLLNPDFTLKQ